MDNEAQGNQQVTIAAEQSPPVSRSLSTSDAMLQIIARAAGDGSVSIDKMTALLDMQERIMAKQAEIDFNAAMVSLNNSGVLRVKKNGTVSLKDKDGNDRGSYNFARWEDMDAVLRPLLNQCDLWLSFDTIDREGGGAKIVATLKHRGGHFQTSTMSLPLDTGPGRNNLQAMGSTLSYGKRYATENLLNIVREGDDDDGVSGGRKTVHQDDALEIERLLDETKADRAAFMKHFGLKSNLLEMSAADVPAAINLLRTKKAKVSAAGQESDKLSHIEAQAKADAEAQAKRQQEAATKGRPEQSEILTEVERAEARRRAEAPRWVAEAIKRIEGFQNQHEMDAEFGHPDYPDMGNKASKQWAAWIEANEPDLFKQLKAAFRAKVRELKTSNKRQAA